MMVDQHLHLPKIKNSSQNKNHYHPVQSMTAQDAKKIMIINVKLVSLGLKRIGGNNVKKIDYIQK